MGEADSSSVSPHQNHLVLTDILQISRKTQLRPVSFAFTWRCRIVSDDFKTQVAAKFEGFSVIQPLLQ